MRHRSRHRPAATPEPEVQPKTSFVRGGVVAFRVRTRSKNTLALREIKCLMTRTKT